MTDLVYNRKTDVSLLKAEEVEKEKKAQKQKKEERIQEVRSVVLEQLDEKTKRLLNAAAEKGASAWLSTLPLQRLGYTLNKREFRDAVCLRYGWDIPDMPSFCGCGKKNSVDHVLICPLGGYTSMRHNALRDTEARFLTDICKDVKIEPKLIPVTRDDIRGNVQEKARLDVSAVGLWTPCEKSFLDIRVSHPNADTYMSKPLSDVYSVNEMEKKNEYGDRVRNCERGTFSPMIFTTTGGMGPECERVNKRIAELLAKKKNEQYQFVISYIRTRLRFALLRATLIAIRGVRGKKDNGREQQIEDISFNLIPLDI